MRRTRKHRRDILGDAIVLAARQGKIRGVPATEPGAAKAEATRPPADKQASNKEFNL